MLSSRLAGMMATALFSHRVRAPSSLVRCAKVELRGGIVAVQACLVRGKRDFLVLKVGEGC